MLMLETTNIMEDGRSLISKRVKNWICYHLLTAKEKIHAFLKQSLHLKTVAKSVEMNPKSK